MAISILFTVGYYDLVHARLNCFNTFEHGLISASTEAIVKT